MNKKILIPIVILIVLGGVFYFYNKKEAQAPTQEGSNQTQTSQQNTTPSVTPSGTQTQTNPSPTNTQTQAGGGETTGSDVQVVEVDFNGATFSPSVVNIHQNDWVFFKNKSTVAFWPATDPYPAENDYTAFNALKTIAPGGEYKFQFTKIGSWGYHDHLDPQITGTVIVAK